MVSMALDVASEGCEFFEKFCIRVRLLPPIVVRFRRTLGYGTAQKAQVVQADGRSLCAPNANQMTKMYMVQNDSVSTERKFEKNTKAG